MYKGIVLDEIQTDAFLSIAANEKLICEKGMTDGVFDRRTHRVPSHWFAEMILEQFAVAGAVYVDPFTYRCLDGELIEKEIIMPYTKCDNDLPGFLAFDIDIVQRMMAEKGFDVKYYTTDKIREIFSEWQEKTQEFLNLEDKYKVDYNVVRFQKSMGLESKIDYNGIDIDHFIELGNCVYHNPIYDVLKEYKKLFNIAYHNDLLSPVINATIHNASSNSETVIPAMEGAEAVKILKFTSERLNTVYTAASLRDSVKLVQTAEAKAYRHKVNEWMMAFSEQNYDNMQIIEHDIAEAQRAMKAKKHITKAGAICATIGAITAFTSHINPSWLPIAGVAAVVNGAPIVSEIATYLGLPPAILDPMKKYRWASFGMRFE